MEVEPLSGLIAGDVTSVVGGLEGFNVALVSEVRNAVPRSFRRFCRHIATSVYWRGFARIFVRHMWRFGISRNPFIHAGCVGVAFKIPEVTGERLLELVAEVALGRRVVVKAHASGPDGEGLQPPRQGAGVQSPSANVAPRARLDLAERCRQVSRGETVDISLQEDGTDVAQQPDTERLVLGPPG